MTALLERLQGHRSRVVQAPIVREGRIVQMVGMRLEAEGCRAPIGSRCRIAAEDGRTVEAEVIGFAGSRLILTPEGGTQGIMPGASVQPLGFSHRVAVDDALLGRVMDGAGHLIDGGAPLHFSTYRALRGDAINPMLREPIREPLDVGVRAINALCTVGRGQRMGLFAGSGVGKSTLLGMMTRHCAADVIVVGLIGERGREVREFIEDVLGFEGRARAVIVATPADDPPLMRLHGAWRATAIAEHFRQQGRSVLLLMDSLTRFAQAQREIGLAAGEPPVSRGYPPSVFSLLPALVERAGNVGSGSLTAFYTVLVEGDDLEDPIADAARAVLDGHLVLSRRIADSGLFPAIDIEASISRNMPAVVDPAQLELVRRIVGLYASYQANRDLLAIGAYKAGSDPALDRAIAAIEPIREFVRQDRLQQVDMVQSLQGLLQLAGKTGLEAGR